MTPGGQTPFKPQRRAARVEQLFLRDAAPEPLDEDLQHEQRLRLERQPTPGAGHVETLEVEMPGAAMTSRAPSPSGQKKSHTEASTLNGVFCRTASAGVRW